MIRLGVSCFSGGTGIRTQASSPEQHEPHQPTTRPYEKSRRKTDIHSAVIAFAGFFMHKNMYQSVENTQSLEIILGTRKGQLGRKTIKKGVIKYKKYLR